MHSGMIGKVAKAHRYADQRERFDIHTLAVTIRGDNADHVVELADDHWSCGCDFFSHNGACAHTMALELLLAGMIPAAEARSMPETIPA
ncbi:MAG: hypothetical protein OXC94_10995 [Chloroflexi bacterium]|nr:hypothetical protein [Chloroflexota bacterium]